jgi:hypothetical protein
MTRLHDIEIREMPSIKAMMKLDREGKQKGESQCQEERRIVGKLKGWEEGTLYAHSQLWSSNARVGVICENALGYK